MYSNNYSQKGFSLIELIIVLTIISALAIVTFWIYPKVRTGVEARKTVNKINMTLAGVHTLYPRGINYHGLTTRMLVNAHLLNGKLKSEYTYSGIVNQWGGVFEVSSTSGRGVWHGPVMTDTKKICGHNALHQPCFSILISQLPENVCLKLIPSVWNEFIYIYADQPKIGQGMRGKTSPNQSLDGKTVINLCNSYKEGSYNHAKNKIIFISK